MLTKLTHAYSYLEFLINTGITVTENVFCFLPYCNMKRKVSKARYMPHKEIYCFNYPK